MLKYQAPFDIDYFLLTEIKRTTHPHARTLCWVEPNTISICIPSQYHDVNLSYLALVENDLFRYGVWDRNVYVSYQTE